MEPFRLTLRRHSFAEQGAQVHVRDPVECVPHAGLISAHDIQRGAGYAVAKRLLDIVLSLLILALCAPLFLVIMLMIRLDSPGPAIFRQTRVGYQGRSFTLYKFRTMHHGSSEALHRAVIARYMRGEMIGATDAATMPRVLFKLEQDPRITRFGRWLRRWSLDELPQFVNVLRGDMTIVGPRPPLWYEVEHYDTYQRQRLQVRPGITGIWQVYGRSRVPFTEMVEMDLAYIRQRSLFLDLKLIWLTVGVVLRQRGAV